MASTQANFNLKLKWEGKNVAFTFLFAYLSVKALVIHISLHLKHGCSDFLGEHDFQWVFWSSFFLPMWKPLLTECIYVLDNSHPTICKTTWMCSLTGYNRQGEGGGTQQLFCLSLLITCLLTPPKLMDHKTGTRASKSLPLKEKIRFMTIWGTWI